MKLLVKLLEFWNQLYSDYVNWIESLERLMNDPFLFYWNSFEIFN